MPINRSVNSVVRNALLQRISHAQAKQKESSLNLVDQRENALKKVEEIITHETGLLVAEIKIDFLKQLEILLSEDRIGLRDQRVYYDEHINVYNENILKKNYYDSTIIDLWCSGLDGDNYYVVEKQLKDNEMYDKDYIIKTFRDFLINIIQEKPHNKQRKNLNKLCNLLPYPYPIDLLLPKIIVKFLDENKRYDYNNNVFVNSMTPSQIAYDFQCVYFNCIELLKANTTVNVSTFTPVFLYKYRVYKNFYMPLSMIKTKLDLNVNIKINETLPHYEKDINIIINNQDFERIRYYPHSLYNLDTLLKTEEEKEIKNDEIRFFFMKVHVLFIKEYVETYRCYRIIDPIKFIPTLKQMLLDYQIGYIKYRYLCLGETYIEGSFQKTHDPIFYSVKDHGSQLLLYYLVYKYCYDSVLDLENKYKKRRLL